MAGKRRGNPLVGALTALLGLLCAAVLGAMFYGTMVYQLAGEQAEQPPAAEGALLGLTLRPTPLPLDVTSDAALLFPGALLALDEPSAVLAEETALDETVGGQTCRVITRTYTLGDGTPVRLISAYPAAYLERLSAPDCQPQLITGFVIDDLDAAYIREGGLSILAARDGEAVYLVEATADETTLYALGAMSSREIAAEPAL